MKPVRTTPRLRPDRGAGSAAGILLVIVLIATLIVAIVLFARADRRANTVRRQSEQQIAGLQRQVRAAEARIRLATLKAEIAAERSAEELAQQLEILREDLAAAYAGARDQALETWDAIELELTLLADQIRDESAEAVATIDRLIERLSPTP